MYCIVKLPRRGEYRTVQLPRRGECSTALSIRIMYRTVQLPIRGEYSTNELDQWESKVQLKAATNRAKNQFLNKDEKCKLIFFLILNLLHKLRFSLYWSTHPTLFPCINLLPSKRWNFKLRDIYSRHYRTKL